MDKTAEALAISSYGTWPSPISAASLAKGAIGVSDLKVMEGRLYWLENRPDENGRLVLMMANAGHCQKLTPEGFNVRTRVHEYGGASYTVIGKTLYFANFADQRLYAQPPGEQPKALTPPGYRYADMVAAPGGGLLGVREDHTDPADVRNAIVAISGQPGDAGHVLFAGSDFVAYPRLSPDGTRVTWMAWDHPNMPWDNTVIYVAEWGAEGLIDIAIVAGGGAESVMEPHWGPDGLLYFISDRTGFWNLYALCDGTAVPIASRSAEFAGPLWSLGQSNYVPMAAGLIAAAYHDSSGSHLLIIETAADNIREIPLPFESIGGLHRVDADTIALLAGSAVQTAAVVTIDIKTGKNTVIRRPAPVSVEPQYISKPEAITFPNSQGLQVHALYYPPVNGTITAPAQEKPPLILQVHGGPTSRASSSFSLSNHFWTSRGFAIVDVDYGGSSGYGRAYRQRLNGQWGIVDVEDVIAAVNYLVSNGRVDASRVAIHGGSAGGFTVLAALSQSAVFKAGASFYGVADLTALARDTHKFESRYLDNLIGPYPAAEDIYRARSPLNHLEGFTAPLIIFQGADDPVVPPNQAHMIRDALRKRKVPVAYLEFQGESHGFRKAENIIASKEAELYFYGRVFGFMPADHLSSIVIENMTPA